MTDIRIKDLTSAAGQLDEFDKFEFIVDVPSAEASMKVSGKEIKGVMAPKQHIHALADVSGLTGELEKKLDKKGGAIAGDLSVMGDTYLRRLHLEEFLEVPEYRYNRVETLVGDKWSAPGCGIVAAVVGEVCTLTVKLEEGEVGTLRENDLCMGIFLNAATDDVTGSTVDSDDSFGNRTYAGFTTCYFRLVECLDPINYSEWRYELRDGYPVHPQVAMHFVAFGNTSDPERQTSRYETRTYMRFLVGMNDWRIRTENIAAQFGDLSNLAAHGLDMTGYSAYLKNISLVFYPTARATHGSIPPRARCSSSTARPVTGFRSAMAYCVSDTSTRRSPAAAPTSMRCCKAFRRRRRYCGRSTPMPAFHPSRNRFCANVDRISATSMNNSVPRRSCASVRRAIASSTARSSPQTGNDVSSDC